MEYKGSYGKEVVVLENSDLNGNKIDTSLIYVVSFYVDSEDRIVGVYPLEPGGYSKQDILSFQPVSHHLFTEELKELKSDEEYVQEIKEAVECYEGEEELEVSWLEGSGEDTEEWVLNVGTIVIEDGFETEEQANALFYKLEGLY
jgi:hypothetical protein